MLGWLLLILLSGFAGYQIHLLIKQIKNRKSKKGVEDNDGNSQSNH